jgi:hypothetical protein
MKGGKLQIEPGEQVLSPRKKEAQPTSSSPNGRPLSSDLGHAMAVKVQGIDGWIHLSRVKCASF